ncbi:uncharacterized protein LOC119986555 [Tripterygium wilfordii]|nr:uncharacterized protein LOC119986555 [Tripterygium wilfordii]
MARGFEETVGSDSDFSTWSVPELISFLRSSFRDAEYDAVESVLVSREGKLKAEIERKAHDNNLCQEIQAFLLAREEKRKTQIRTIMEKEETMRKEYEVELLKKTNLENELQKCRAEVLELGVRNSQISEEIKQCRDREDTLKSEMESAKRRAETEVEMWKRRFRDLEMGISNLEKDTSELMELQNMENVVPENIVTDEMILEKEANENLEILTDGNRVDVKIEADTINCNDDLKSDSAVVVNSGSSRPPSNAIIEIIDSDDDWDAGGSLVSKDRALDSANSGQTGKGNGTRLLKRKQPSSPFLGENEGGRTVDHKEDVDDSILIGQHEIQKATELITGPVNSIVNNCSAIATASGSHNGEKVLSQETKRQCGEKTRADAIRKFMNGLSLLSLPEGLLDGLESSSSSSSSSSFDSEDD